jgi:hypothetical protein
MLTPPIKSNIGVRQGDNLSPTLFNIFINDLPDIFTEDCCPAIFGNLKIQCLLYADDLVITSETYKGMQKALKLLEGYCNTWGLEINMRKTKIMGINAPVIPTAFTYKGRNLEQVTRYCYLGIEFSETGDFRNAKIELYKKGLKALFKLKKMLNPMPNVKTALHLFDHLIKPIVLYGSEIWGPINLTQTRSQIKVRNEQEQFWYDLNNTYQIETKYTQTDSPFEKLHLKFLKCILGVHNNSTNMGAYGELGRFPLYTNIVTNSFEYLDHLDTNNNNKLLEQVYTNMKELNHPKQCNIINFTRQIKEHTGITVRGTYAKNIKYTLKRELQSRFKNFWYAKVNTNFSNRK